MAGDSADVRDVEVRLELLERERLRTAVSHGSARTGAATHARVLVVDEHALPRLGAALVRGEEVVVALRIAGSAEVTAHRPRRTCVLGLSSRNSPGPPPASSVLCRVSSMLSGLKRSVRRVSHSAKVT